MKHDSVAHLRFIPPIRRAFAAVSIILSLVFALAAFGVPQGTSWTYQGQLRRGGAAYNGTCDFQFSLWNALSAGGQVGPPTRSIDGVNVVNGLFTVTLDFGVFFGDQFTGEARWLGTSVQCSGDGGFTPLDPRQPITATPYALSLRPGAEIIGQGIGVLFVQNLRAGGDGLYAFANEGAAVRGDGSGTSSVGLYGTASGTNSIGVLGTTTDSTAVYGQTTGSGAAIYGQSLGTGKAGEFAGSVNVQGTLTKSAGSFQIDHPLDPANKFLSHSFVESPDMKNIYDGNVTTDATGSATVTMPNYFEALNRDYRYQLTVLGQFAQAIVSRKIAGNTFEIRTDKPGVEVSWQVTGIRQDAYAKAKPIVVEEFKPAEEQGLYLYPAGFGAGEEKRIGYPSRPVTPQTEQKITKKTK